MHYHIRGVENALPHMRGGECATTSEGWVCATTLRRQESDATPINVLYFSFGIGHFCLVFLNFGIGWDGSKARSQ